MAAAEATAAEVEVDLEVSERTSAKKTFITNKQTEKREKLTKTTPQVSVAVARAPKSATIRN